MESIDRAILIEKLTEAYIANEALKASELYIKENDGAALRAAHEEAKAERLAQRVAAHTAKLTNVITAPTCIAVERDKTEPVTPVCMALAHETGEL